MTMDANFIGNGMNALALVDQEVAQAFKAMGAPAPRYRAEGFEAFLSIIVSQQISARVASVIMGRVTGLLPELSARAVLSVDEQALRQAGLSFRKIEYAKGLARAVLNGQFDIDRLEKMSDEEAITAIMALRGFGRWSAEIYLLFSLKRPNIFPADDLALRVALGRLKQLPDKPTPKQARNLVAHWAPWRSVGSLFLWHYYQGAPA